MSEKSEIPDTLFSIDNRNTLISLIDSSGDFIALTEPGGKLWYINPAGRRMVGLAGDASIDRLNINDLLVLPLHDQIPSGIPDGDIERRTWKQEGRLRQIQTGVMMDVESHISPILDSGSKHPIGWSVLILSSENRTKSEQYPGMLNGIIHTIADIMIMMTPDRTIAWANDMAHEFFGSELVGKKCHEIFYQFDSPCSECLVENTCEDGLVHEQEVSLIDRDGNRKVFWCSANVAVRDKLGRSTLILEILRDFTERKILEEELAAHRDQLAFMVRKRTRELEEVNRDLRIINEISKAAQSASDLGEYLQEVYRHIYSVLGVKNFFIALYDDDKDIIHFPYFVDEMDDIFTISEAQTSGSLTAEVIQTGKTLLLNEVDIRKRYESKEKKPWGTISKSWLGVPLVTEDQFIGVLGIQDYEKTGAFREKDRKLMESISSSVAMAISRKQAENTLRESEARFRYLSEASYEAIFISKKGICIEANKAAGDMFGYSLDELIGIHGTQVIAPESREMVRQNMMLEEAGPYEAVGLRKDGATFPVEIQAKNIPYGNQAVRVTAVRDITEFKRYMQELISYQKRLRIMGSELSLAEERERRRIATDLHDHIGQSLAISKLTLKTLQRNISRSDQQKALEEVIILLDQMIMETRTLTMQLSPPMLYDLGLEAALEWLCEQIQQNHHLDIHFHGETSGVELDDNIRMVLFRSVRELLLNVVKHAKASHADIRIHIQDQKYKVHVEDNGVGFDPGLLERDYGRSNRFGLFSIRERLGAMGGCLKIETAPSRGVRATLEIPIG